MKIPILAHNGEAHAGKDSSQPTRVSKIHTWPEISYKQCSTLIASWVWLNRQALAAVLHKWWWPGPQFAHLTSKDIREVHEGQVLIHAICWSWSSSWQFLWAQPSLLRFCCKGVWLAEVSGKQKQVVFLAPALRSGIDGGQGGAHFIACFHLQGRCLAKSFQSFHASESPKFGFEARPSYSLNLTMRWMQAEGRHH